MKQTKYAWLVGIILIIGLIGMGIGGWGIYRWSRVQYEITLARKAVLDDNPRKRERALWTLLRYGERLPIQKLLSWARSDDEYVRMAVMLHLRQWGGDGVPALLKALESPTIEELLDGSMLRTPRQVIVSALINPEPDVIAKLIDNLDTKHPLVRITCIEVLARIGSPAIPKLINVIRRSKNNAVRTGAIDALGRMGEGALPTLKRIVEEQGVDNSTKIAAVNAIGNIRSSDALLFLKRIVNKPALQDTALSAIGRIGSPDAVSFLLKWAEDNEPSIALITALGATRSPRVVDVLLKWLDMGNESLNGAIAFALGTIGDKRAVPKLMELVKENAPGAPAAAIALGQLRDRRALPVLRAALRSANPEVRGNAVSALQLFNDASVIDDLKPLLRDPDPTVRARARSTIEFLKKFGM